MARQPGEIANTSYEPVATPMIHGPYRTTLSRHSHASVRWLFRPAFVTLRDHLNHVHLRGVRNLLPVRIFRAPREDKQRLLVAAAESDADNRPRRRYQAKPRPVGTDHLHARIGAHLEAAFGVDGAAVASRFRLQLREVALVGERSIRLYIERHDRTDVRHVQFLFIGAENDPVRAQVVAILRDDARGAR